MLNPHDEYTMKPNPQNHLAISAALLVAELAELVEQRAAEAAEEAHEDPTPFDVDKIADDLIDLLCDYLTERQPTVNQLTIPHAASHFGVRLTR